MEKNKSFLQQKLSEPIQLPALAKNIHILLQTLSDDDLNYQQVADVIKHYPEITARLIFLVNSPWSAPISPINNIEQACSRLGTSIVKSISIAISIASSFDTGKCPSFSTVHFWTTSMLVSEGAGLLASKLPEKQASLELENTAQTAGILHTLGFLWLADNLPIETDKALQMVADESCSLSVSDALSLNAGADYCKIGGWIARELKLPEVLMATMEHHLNDNYQDASWEVALLVRAAANMATALHQQVEEISTNQRLEKLGLDAETQRDVFQKLRNHFENTHELAQTLFAG